jgi:glycosyltransferase involved in cell wall biosynthesis
MTTRRRVSGRELSLSTLSIVIPALNERANIAKLIDGIPYGELAACGWDTELLVVDNGSVDGTGELARQLGARVVVQPVRGYGNAYKAGFANSTGSVIATGDADLTYPFDDLPRLLDVLLTERIEIMTTNRLHPANREAMKPSHTFGNRVLSSISRGLFRNGLADSQSGMWIFRRYVWDWLDVRSGGMPFSQEIKNEAHRKGFHCAELPIEYRVRGGDVKLNAAKDGVRNLTQLFGHRCRRAGAMRPPLRAVVTAGHPVPRSIHEVSVRAEEATGALAADGTRR